MALLSWAKSSVKWSRDIYNCWRKVSTGEVGLRKGWQHTTCLQFNRHPGNWIMVQYRDTSCQIYCQALPSTGCCIEQTNKDRMSEDSIQLIFPTASAYLSFRGLKRLKYSWTISSEWDAGVPSCHGMQQICTGRRMIFRPTNTMIFSVNIEPPISITKTGVFTDSLAHSSS